MSNIKPALTAEEWAARRTPTLAFDGTPDEEDCLCIEEGDNGPELRTTYDWDAGRVCLDPAKTIALANAALPDDDPRKITREHVALLRRAVTAIMPAWDEGMYATDVPDRDEAALRLLADILESYLPPEPGT